MQFQLFSIQETDQHFNLLSDRGKKSKVARYIKQHFQMTLSEFLENKFGDQISSQYRCKICNTIICPIDYNLRSENQYIILEDYQPFTKSKVSICSGTESDIARNCKVRRKGLNPNSAEFIMLIGAATTIDEAKKLIRSRNKSPFYRENYISDEEYTNAQRRDRSWFSSDEEFNAHREKLKKSHTIDRYIEKYGEEAGRAQYNDICSQKASCSLTKKIERYGEIVGPMLYQQHVENTRQTESAFIRRYGADAGIKKWHEYRSRHPMYSKENNKMCLEYWLKLYSDPLVAEAERQKHIKSRNTFSKEFCIRKYGAQAGTERYWQYLQAQADARPRNMASKESLGNFFIEFMRRLPDDIQYFIGVEGNKEYFISSVADGIKFYDFTIPELSIIIEYHGSLWHYNEDNLLESCFMTIEQRRIRDATKQRIAEEAGYDYYVVFDTDDFSSKIEYLINKVMEKYNASRN